MRDAADGLVARVVASVSCCSFSNSNDSLDSWWWSSHSRLVPPQRSVVVELTHDVAGDGDAEDADGSIFGLILFMPPAKMWKVVVADGIGISRASANYVAHGINAWFWRKLS